MAKTPVRAAVIGLDHWYAAIPLTQALATHPDVELVGVADAEPDRAREVAAKAGGARFSESGREFLDDPSVDVIAAFAGSDRNPATCVAAAEAGKHIVSIKPLARDLDDATEILRAVRRSGVGFLPAECRGRLSPLHRQLKGWVEEGKLGRPLTATFQMWAGLPQGWPGADGPGWFVDPDRAPGGGWIDHSIYHVDLLRWLFDATVTSVSGTVANLRHTGIGVEDYGHAIVEFDNDLVATIEDTWTAVPGASRSSFSLVGTEAAVVSDTLSGKVSLSGALQPFDGWAEIPRTGGYPETVDDVVALARGEGDALGTVEDAWRNLAVCRAFYDAAASGRSVVPEPLPA